MKQADLGLNPTTKRARRPEFLAQMEHVVPWAALAELVVPYAPEGKKDRSPFAVEAMLRIHFAVLGWDSQLADERTILRFRHLLERHKLAEQILAVVNDLLSGQGLLLKAATAVDATLIVAPRSTKNKDGRRDPEMHQSKKLNQ